MASLNERISQINGSRLIVPLVSLGGVAQLAADLLIASLAMDRVSSMTSDFHIPVIGALDRSDPCLVGLSTPLELYHSADMRLTLLHQRSPPLKSRKGEYVDALCRWIKLQAFEAVLLLGSMDASTRRDADLASPFGSLRCLAPAAATERPLGTSLRGLCPPHRSAASKADDTIVPLVPAGGLMRRLHTALSTDTSLDHGAIVAYVVEGDNEVDAQTLAQAALRAFGLSALHCLFDTRLLDDSGTENARHAVVGAERTFSVESAHADHLAWIAGISKPSYLQDLDGLLIDSETVYTKAGQELLRPYGKEFTWAIKSEMMGQPAREAMQVLLDRTGIPLSLQEAIDKSNAMQLDLFRQVQPLPGALRLVEHLRQHGVPMAIATGSQQARVKLKTAHLTNLMACFPDPKLIVTADDPMLKPGRGKPEPDVFLIAASRLGMEPRECLVFEDGLPGVEAARRAGMPCVWVPDPALRAFRAETQPESEESLGAAQILDSLEQFRPQEWELAAF